MIGKQAKILSPREITQVLAHVKTQRYAERNEVMVLLSLKAGLRAKEISLVTWSMVTDASRQTGEVLHLPDHSSKGQSGRIIPLNKELKKSLINLYQLVSPEPNHYIITSERGAECYLVIYLIGLKISLNLFGWKDVRVTQDVEHLLQMPLVVLSK